MNEVFDANIVGPVTPSQAELDIVHRRELAISATEAVSAVLDVDVTVRGLVKLLDSEDKDLKLTAKRSLRCIESVSRPNSAVLQAIGETGIYHYVEAVIEFGASESLFLSLAKDNGLKAFEVTALYALRESIAEYSNGRKPGFEALGGALKSIGLTVKEASADADAAVVALYERGWFRDTSAGGYVYDRPIFAPSGVHLVEDDADGTLSEEILLAHRAELGRPLEEIEGEGDDNIARQIAATVEEMLKS